MGRILGIDFGIARVGLAMTDLLKITAQPMDTLNINGNVELLIDKVKELKTNSNVDLVVIGYPKHMNGDLSETTKIVDSVILRIEELGLKVVKWDERLTTVMAHKAMREMGLKQKDKKVHADRLAAMYILEDYLKSQNC